MLTASRFVFASSQKRILVLYFGASANGSLLLWDPGMWLGHKSLLAACFPKGFAGEEKTKNKKPSRPLSLTSKLWCFYADCWGPEAKVWRAAQENYS